MKKDFEIFKNFIFDPFVTFFYFPFWWYSRGLLKFFNFLKRNIEEIACPFVLKILFQNLVRPMYGDYSREGRIISFFMRWFHFSWRIFKIIFVFLFSLLLFIIYLLILPFVFYKIFCFLGQSCYYFFWPPFF